MFAAILFDLDNTLIDRDQAFGRFVASCFEDPEDRQNLIELDRGGCGNREALFERWRQLSGQSMDMKQFGLRLSEFIWPNELLLESLKQLAQVTTIGIITNGGVVTQEMKWRAAGLDRRITRDRLWISQELGIEKPDPAIFKYVCDQLAISPEDSLYVGDQPSIDIQGARSAGLATQWVSRPLTGKDILNEFVVGACYGD